MVKRERKKEKRNTYIRFVQIIIRLSQLNLEYICMGYFQKISKLHVELFQKNKRVLINSKQNLKSYGYLLIIYVKKIFLIKIRPPNILTVQFNTTLTKSYAVRQTAETDWFLCIFFVYQSITVFHFLLVCAIYLLIYALFFTKNCIALSRLDSRTFSRYIIDRNIMHQFTGFRQIDTFTLKTNCKYIHVITQNSPTSESS